MRNYFKKLMNITVSDDGGVSRLFDIFRLAIIAVTLCTGIAVIILLLDLIYHHSLKPDLAKFAQIGDFIGGILNPVLAFIVLLLLLMTTRLQKHELNETRTAIEKQNFESSFFNLLNILENYKSNMDIIHSNKNVLATGSDCFKWIYKNRLKINFRKRTGEDYSFYEKTYNDYNSDLGSYFRILFNIYRYLDGVKKNTNLIFDIEIYTKLLRATLSDYELAIIFYNCLSNKGKSMIQYDVKFDIFDNLPKQLIIDEQHKVDYEKLVDEINKELDS